MGLLNDNADVLNGKFESCKLMGNLIITDDYGMDDENDDSLSHDNDDDDNGDHGENVGGD